ncbi:MAG TPA: hypothetical protein VF861_12985 [Telluria sp.]
MMMLTKRLAAPMAALALAAGATAAQPVAAPASQPVSQAETLLFETDHLERLRAPATLSYAFHKSGNVEPGFDDTVQLVLAQANGKKQASVHFLTGPRKHDIPAVDDAHGNPVLLGFLEYDIAAMKRRTGGSTNYFRKRIRMALAEAARVTREPIAYGGQQLQASVIRIQPYLNDPLHARFEKYVGKTYTFVVSEQVPGGVYQVRTALGTATSRSAGAQPPAAKVGAPAVFEESLTLVKVAQSRH